MTTQTEIWKDIPGQEGRYQVSDRGRVRSTERVIQYPAYELATGLKRAASARVFQGKDLKPGTCDKFGHCSVAIGRGNSQMVHSLVALAFLGPRPEGHDVAHLNGDGSDNRVENLAYTSRSVNNQHVVYHGRRLLTVADIHALRARAALGFSHGAKTQVAKAFGISLSFMGDVLKGRCYAHV